jgi:hypothetical protein
VGKHTGHAEGDDADDEEQQLNAPLLDVQHLLLPALGSDAAADEGRISPPPVEEEEEEGEGMKGIITREKEGREKNVEEVRLAGAAWRTRTRGTQWHVGPSAMGPVVPSDFLLIRT